MVVHEQSIFIFLHAWSKDTRLEELWGVFLLEHCSEELAQCWLDSWKCKLDVLDAIPRGVWGFVVINFICGFEYFFWSDCFGEFGGALDNVVDDW